MENSMTSVEVVLKVFSDVATEKTAEKIYKAPATYASFGITSPLRVTFVSNQSSQCRGEEKPGSVLLQHDVRSDCQRLSSMELRDRYPAEANSHRNMLHRQKMAGAVVHHEFRVFREFLAHVGAIPCKGATLDRINNKDREYGPGKVRWADKRTQNNNKGDTLLFHYSRTGDTYTVSRLAKLLEVSPSAIRKRRERGWSDDEIIEGRCARDTSALPRATRQELSRTRYKSGSSPSSSRPKFPDAAEVIFRRNRDYAEHERRENGEEYCLADLGALNECFAELGIRISPETYERKFEKWWMQQKPHLIRRNLPMWAQELINRIELRQQSEKEGARDAAHEERKAFSL